MSLRENMEKAVSYVRRHLPTTNEIEAIAENEPEPDRKIKKVVFCIDHVGLYNETAQWLKVALRSVAANTNLTPMVLYSGDEIEVCQAIAGPEIQVINTRTRLHAVIAETRASGTFLPPHAEGAFLRYEIPSLFPDDSHILYADCDTYFFATPICPETFDGAVGCVPSSQKASGDYHFNSGIIIFNTAEFRKSEDDLFSFFAKTLGNWLPSSVDERAFNAFWGQGIYVLPRSLNWRPRWGFEENIEILHLHGFKTNVVALLEGDTRNISRSVLDDYIYELAREYSSSTYKVWQYLDLMYNKGHLSDTAMESVYLRLKDTLQTDKLLAYLFRSISELSGGAHQLLKSADEGTQSNTIKIIPPTDNVEYIRIHPCTKVGKGVIRIVLPIETNSKEFEIQRNSSLDIEVYDDDDNEIVIHWAGIGLDCHMTLTSANPDTPQLHIKEIIITQEPSTVAPVYYRNDAGHEFQIPAE
ncbi:hypothetical protein FPY71_14385 [Aureimonas fodinaquatilis]|uniref:Glycosyl transferase n=1 Tax=Aureimonas fodinaquatilis TaxID=2565783 RepID=A0A5B0DTF3_9HYPH|nr:hypothetical protein [Aureimonas fodinaquatilis]KAA0969703.1 hypothetical protein FPY71_14385 [Aureimonas fodinaquatilis]